VPRGLGDLIIAERDPGAIMINAVDYQSTAERQA
jgi:hypothetical protein